MASEPALELSRPNSGLTRHYVEALSLVAVATLAGLAIATRWGNVAVDLLYLPAVLFSAMRGLRPAFLSALVSALAYNYFFTAPIGSFRVTSPADLLSIIVLFLVAAVASHLTASVQKQARLAAAHASRNSTIAGLARQLLSCATEEDVGQVAADQLAALFRCNAVFVVSKPDLVVLGSAPGRAALEVADLAAATLALETGEPAGRAVERAAIAEWQFQPIRSQSTIRAAIGLARNDGAPPVETGHRPLLQSLLDQIALSLERVRVQAVARDLAATRAQDQTRATLLATIAEDLTPSVQRIGSDVNQLRRSGEANRELVANLAADAARLSRYIDKLTDLVFETDRQPVWVGDIKVDLFRRTVSKAGQEVHLPPKEYALLAELAKQPGRVLSHGHLLRAVWGPAQERQIEYLRVAIRGLRQKLEHDPASPQLILNEPSVGYRLASK